MIASGHHTFTSDMIWVGGEVPALGHCTVCMSIMVVGSVDRVGSRVSDLEDTFSPEHGPVAWSTTLGKHKVYPASRGDTGFQQAILGPIGQMIGAREGISTESLVD